MPKQDGNGEVSRRACRPAPSPRYWTIPVWNHDEIIAGCERAGVPIVKPTVHAPEDGVRFTLLADPDGHIVEILGYPDDTRRPDSSIVAAPAT